MDNESGKHSSVGKNFEIDQRAEKTFLNWIPDHWLARKQSPDFYIDFLVEIVEHGEPTGRHFGVQIKGQKSETGSGKSPEYSFKTKHLDYYLSRSQYPIFLVLIDVTNCEGYWVFAQKLLRDKMCVKLLRTQKSLTIHFPRDDNLSNLTKFKCLLPEAERFVRDLHPGSVKAALEKRKATLESLDPRCEVRIDIANGAEHIIVNPKEPFSFKAQIRTKNIEGWKNFIEKGAAVKLEPGELKIIGAPLLAELHNDATFSTMHLGNHLPARFQIVSGEGKNLNIVLIDGITRGGTKFITISGALSEGPLEIEGEIAREDINESKASMHFLFSLDKWDNQRVLLLQHFDAISQLVQNLSEGLIPKMDILIQGNVLWSGSLGGLDLEKFKKILFLIRWIDKCRWIAKHFKVNPRLPCLADISDQKWTEMEEVYGLIKDRQICVPEPGKIITFEASNVPSMKEFFPSGYLRIDNAGQDVDFFGAMIRLPPAQHMFNEMRLESRTEVENGRVRFVFETNERTKRTSTLL